METWKNIKNGDVVQYVGHLWILIPLEDAIGPGRTRFMNLGLKWMMRVDYFDDETSVDNFIELCNQE